MDNNFQKPVNEVNFGPNDSAWGRDIEKIGKAVQEKKSSPETKTYSDHDFVKQAIRPMVYPQGQAAPSQAQQSEEDKFLPDYLKSADPKIKNQVEKLLEDTIRNGLVSGINEARKMSPFILDAYHDALTDKLHEELKKRKII